MKWNSTNLTVSAGNFMVDAGHWQFRTLQCNCFRYRAWHVIQSMETAREWTTACHCWTIRSAVFSVRWNKNWPITLAPLHQRDANRPNVVTVEELNGARQITRPNTEHKYTGASASGSLYQTNAESSASFTQSGRHPPIIIIIKNKTGFVFL